MATAEGSPRCSDCEPEGRLVLLHDRLNLVESLQAGNQDNHDNVEFAILLLKSVPLDLVSRLLNLLSLRIFLILSYELL